MILDCRFFGVNDETVPLVPMDTIQFAHTFECLLVHHLNHAYDCFGLVYMSDIDPLSDGFYSLWLHLEDSIKLEVLSLDQENLLLNAFL